MLSKIILSFTIFVVVCFISGVVGIETVVCNTDDDFLKEVNDRKEYNFLPVLITKNQYPIYDRFVEQCLTERKHYTLIKVNVNNDPCPITNKYFFTENLFPSLHVIVYNRPHNDWWNPWRGNDINKFLDVAEKSYPAKSGTMKSVTEELGDRISERNRLAFYQAARGNLKQAADPYGWLPRSSSPSAQSRTEYMFMPHASRTNSEVPLSYVRLVKRDQRSPDSNFLPWTQMQTQKRQRTEPDWGDDLTLRTPTVDKGKAPQRH